MLILTIKTFQMRTRTFLNFVKIQAQKSRVIKFNKVFWDNNIQGFKFHQWMCSLKLEAHF